MSKARIPRWPVDGTPSMLALMNEMTPRRDLATEFYRACNPAKPLEVGDPRYVSLHQARGENWRASVERALRRAEQPGTRLLSGFLGDGKTTELRWMQHDLETGDDPFAVVMIEADQYINRDEYSVLDVLLAVIAVTGHTLRERFAIELRPNHFQRRMEEVKAKLFSDVELETLGISGKVDAFKLSAKIGLKMRESHEVSAQLWNTLGHERATLADEFRKLLEDEARPALLTKGRRDLVLLIDGLEKLEDDPERQRYEQVFVQGASVLRNLGAHAILTLPPSLAYSTAESRLTDQYGGQVHVIPAARVADFCAAHCGDMAREHAFATLRDLVRKRVPEATDGRDALARAFESTDLLDDFIGFSGGHVRTLLILIREALDELDDLPITRAAFEAVQRRWIIAASRELRTDVQHRVAAQVHETHLLPSDELGLETAMDMLQSLHLLAYHNGREFYEVRPAVLEIEQVRDALQRRRDR